MSKPRVIIPIPFLDPTLTEISYYDERLNYSTITEEEIASLIDMRKDAIR